MKRLPLFLCILAIFSLLIPTTSHARRFNRASLKNITRAVRKNTRQAMKPSFTIRSRYAGAMTGLSFSSDGDWFATAGKNGSAQVWDMRTGQQGQVFNLGREPIQTISFVPGRSRIILAQKNKGLSLWDINSGKKIRDIVPDNEDVKLASITPYYLKGQQARGLRFNIKQQTTFSPDEYTGQYVITLGSANRSQNSIKVWNIDTGKLTNEWQIHKEKITSLTVSEVGFLAASADNSGKILLWNWQTGKILHEFSSNKTVNSLALNKLNSTLAAGLENGTLLLWRIKNSQKLFSIKAHENPIRDLSFSPDTAYITTIGSNKIKIWSTANGELVKEISGHTANINAISYSTNNKYLLTVSDDKTSRLWDASKGKELVTMVSMRDGWAAVSPSGYFDGTLDGATEDRLDAIQWTVGKRSFSVDGFMDGYYRPALLGRIMAGQDLSQKDGLPDISMGFKLPPLVRFQQPTPDSKQKNRLITVTIEATDQGGGIQEIKLFHNKKVVNDSQAEIKTKKYKDTVKKFKTYRLQLNDTANILRAVALSTDKIESESTEIAVNYRGAKDTTPPGLHLFVVGLNSYKNPALNLNFGVPDAKAVTRFFNKSVGPDFATFDKVELFDKDADKKGISSMLEEMHNIPAQDTVVIYFAGHGETVDDNWYFIPYDLAGGLSKKEAVSKSGISSQFLKECVTKSGAQRIVILLDACKSGAAVDLFSNFEDQRPFAMLSRATGIHIAAASTKDQYASELEDLGHGVFTFSLLRAMDGQADVTPSDGRITVLEILDYVKKEMPHLIKENNSAAQKPIINSRGIDFVVMEK